MIGYIEWTSRETRQVERASVTRCTAADGIYRLAFSHDNLQSEGEIALCQGTQVQAARGHYSFKDNSYEGEADVLGQTTCINGLVRFTGTWRDPRDTTGPWDLHIEFANQIPLQAAGSTSSC